MFISKTQKKMIDVARDLFAKKGKKNVTMNDIAASAAKGRRTLYTYFKNKDDIYKAVIEEELNFVYDKLWAVSQKDILPHEKLTEHILTHLDAIKTAVIRNGSLRSDFFQDISEVERVRKRIDYKEIILIRQILDAGIRAGQFIPMNINMSATIILYSLKGLEVPYIRQNISHDFERHKREVVNFILRSIKKGRTAFSEKTPIK